MSVDGTHVWVANYDQGTVIELDASTGAYSNGSLAASTFSAGEYNPEAISSDGTHVWVALGNGHYLTELDASTGAVVQTIQMAALGNQTDGVVSDGTHVWVTNYDEDTVVELDAATGAYANGSLAASTIAVGGNPEGVTADGNHVWVANSSDGTVTELDASTGAYSNGSVAASTFRVGSRPVGVSSDGTNVWVTNYGTTTVSEINILADIPSVAKFTPASGPVGTVVTIKGTNLSGATKVTFNGLKGTITSDSATKIEVKVPSGATTGKIKVVTPGGQSKSTTSFTVT